MIIYYHFYIWIEILYVSVSERAYHEIFSKLQQFQQNKEPETKIKPPKRPKPIKF